MQFHRLELGSSTAYIALVGRLELFTVRRISKFSLIQVFVCGGMRVGLHEESVEMKVERCRRAFCWNSMWRNLQRHEVIESSGEVNWLIDGPCGERLPAIDLAHADLTGGEQRPEQHGGSLC